MSDFPDLVPPWSRVPLVHDDTDLFPQPTMDALDALYAGGGGGGGGLDAESVRDVIGVALRGTGLISVAVNDAADTITLSTTATVNDTDANLKARANHTGTQSADTITDGTTNKAYTAAEKTKLAGIEPAASANFPDAFLLDRANHTGTQAQATVTNLVTDLGSKLSGTGITAVVAITQAAYNALGTPNATTLYLIIG